MKQGKKLLICSVLGALSMTGSVYAAMPTDMTNHPTPVYELKGVTVTANRQAEDINSVPANVSIVTGSQIKAKNIQTVAQAIAMAPGMQLDQANEGAEVRMRGYDSKNVLVLVDGQPVNNSYSGQAYLSVLPVDTISRIEVVRGGQSALYGGNAVGGVVNIITNTTRHDGVYGTVLEGYGSNNTVRQVYDVRGKKGKVTFGAFYENRSTDGWRNYKVTQAVTDPKASTRPKPAPEPNYGNASDHLQQDTAGKYIIGDRGRQAVMSESYGVQVGYNFNADQSINYKYTHGNYSWKYNDPRMYTTNANGDMVWVGHMDAGNGNYVSLTPSGSALGAFGYRNFDMHSLTYNDEKSLFHFHAGLTKYTRDANVTLSSVDPKDPYNGKGLLSNYPSQNLTMDMNKRWKLGEHTLLLGAYYAQGKFDQKRFNITDWKDIYSDRELTDWFGGKIRTWAMYVQDKWALTDKLTAYVGGRYDHFEKYGGYYRDSDTNETKPHDSASYGQFSPKFSLEYAQDDSTHYYVSYGRSFNPPQLYELYRAGDILNKHYFGNPDLKPETTDNWELGVKKQVGDKTSITADVFKAKTKDYIYTTTHGDPTDTGYNTYSNVGKADTKGFELSVNHTFSDLWSSYLNYTWQIGTIDESGGGGRGEHKNYQIPQHLFHMGVTYTNNPWTVSLDGVFTSSRNDPGNTRDPELYTGRFGSYDPYFLLNLDSNYQFNKNMSMQFSIYNIFNREFYDNELTSGRTYNVAVRYTF